MTLDNKMPKPSKARGEKIAKIIKDGFQISVIPHTLKLTNLIKLKEKDLVNVEFDILTKYIKKITK